MKAMMSDKLRNLLKDPEQRRELQQRLPQLHRATKQDKVHPQKPFPEKSQGSN